jgi:glutamyl-tRNA reductase
MAGDSLIAVGLSHRTAPVEVRERMAFSPDEVRRRLAELRHEHICDEAILLSTCNRVELYAVPSGGDITRVAAYLEAFRGPRGEPIGSYLYWHRGRSAVEHLFRVASSLDSLVVGEPQILGQVRDAVKTAEEVESMGRVLRPLSRQCLSVAKRVRTETTIGRSRVGVGNAGVDLAQQIFGALDGRRAMLIGAGEMGRQVARALLSAGLTELVVVNRTYERAVEVAGEYGGTAIAMERMTDYLPRVDVVICASGAQRPILRVPEIKVAIRARRYRPLFLVDLAVPRNVDPAVGELDEAYLFNVDDLVQVVEQGRREREEASKVALKLVNEEVTRFVSRLAEINVGPRLGQVVRRAEAVRQAELERSHKLVDGLEPAQRKALDAMTRAMMKKVLDEPLRAIRDAARSGDAERLAVLLEQWSIEDDA